MSAAPSTGHGHVIPRADGAKARCGGPALCRECKMEYLTVEWERYRKMTLEQLKADVGPALWFFAGALSAYLEPGPKATLAGDYWTCAECGVRSAMLAANCVNCGASRPAVAGAKTGGRL